MRVISTLRASSLGAFLLLPLILVAKDVPKFAVTVYKLCQTWGGIKEPFELLHIVTLYSSCVGLFDEKYTLKTMPHDNSPRMWVILTVWPNSDACAEYVIYDLCRLSGESTERTVHPVPMIIQHLKKTKGISSRNEWNTAIRASTNKQCFLYIFNWVNTHIFGAKLPPLYANPSHYKMQYKPEIGAIAVKHSWSKND